MSLEQVSRGGSPAGIHVQRSVPCGVLHLHRHHGLPRDVRRAAAINSRAEAASGRKTEDLVPKCASTLGPTAEVFVAHIMRKTSKLQEVVSPYKYHCSLILTPRRNVNVSPGVS